MRIGLRVVGGVVNPSSGSASKQGGYSTGLTVVVVVVGVVVLVVAVVVVVVVVIVVVAAHLQVCPRVVCGVVLGVGRVAPARSVACKEGTG